MAQGKLNLTLATGVVGWNTTVNGQLVIEFAKNPKVKVTGLVPSSTQEQKEEAKKLNVELVDAKERAGFSPEERLSFPPDNLEIDILIIHSYGLHEGKHAQNIKDAKKCKWLHIIHTNSEELAKFMETEKDKQKAEYQLQLTLCNMADGVIAIGPRVAGAFRSALHYGGKNKDVINLTPGIIYEMRDIRLYHQREEIFRILISATYFAKYYKVKGLDIAAKAISLLQEVDCYLIFVVTPNEDVEDLSKRLYEEGIDLNQFAVRHFKSNSENWKQLLCEVNLIIMPSRTEGFGTSSLRAISADLPVLVSQNCGLGMALKKLPSGGKHVVKSNDPKEWSERIKTVLESNPEDQLSESKQLRREYEEQYSWEKQCDDLVEKMLKMFPSKQEDLKQSVEHSEEFEQGRGQYSEVQQYETERMVYEERISQNVNLSSQELRLAVEKNSSHAERKASNEETVDAVQKGIQELSLEQRKIKTERMNNKGKFETVQSGTQELGRATAKNVNGGFDQVDSVRAALDGVNDNNANKGQIRQPVKSKDIPYSVLGKVCMKLNIKDDLSFRDFRLLGEKMGFDKDLTKVLEQKGNPTYELLQLWHASSESTMERLITILKDDEMGRWDVATILEDWLKTKNK